MNANRRVTRSRLTSSEVSICAAALFVFAQAIGLLHDLEAENVAPGHVCAVCVAGGNLDAADVGSADTLIVERPIVGVVAALKAAPLSQTRIFRPAVRGPPVAS